MVVTPDFRPSRPGSDHSTPLSPLSLASSGPSHPPIRRSSTGNYSHISDFRLDDDASESKDDSNSVRGVRHVNLSLDIGEWRQPVFKEKILNVLKRMPVPSWNCNQLFPSSIHLQRVSGALTNAVFFVSFNPNPRPTSPTMSPLLTPTLPPADPLNLPPFPPTDYPVILLLRIYGPSSDALISRSEELRILHVLSTQYGLGPKVYGTFTNGRVEEFFPSRALTSEEPHDPKISRGIARRMRELHSVDLKALGYNHPEVTVWKCIDQWVTLAEDVMVTLKKVNSTWEKWVNDFGLDRVRAEVEEYTAWVKEKTKDNQHMVFSHNDTQYGNILRLDATLPKELPDHHKYIVIDFEYAAPNPRGYDIANHFHERRGNYHHPEFPHVMEMHYPYPTPAQREAFYRAYLSIDISQHEEKITSRKDVPPALVEDLESEVRIWSPASSCFWGLWGIVQAEDQVRGLYEGKGPIEFDYLEYALGRMEMFRKEATEVGALKPRA